MNSSEKKLQKSQSLRQRITPTYVHQQIFNEAPTQLHKTRCTPTFSSTVFDCEGYNTITHHSRAKNEELPTTAGCVTYRNVSKQRKQIEVFSYRGAKEDSQKQTDRKEQILHSINDYGARTSRMRKIVQQMSNPVFGSSYFWEPNLNQEPKAPTRQTETIKQVAAETKQQITKQQQGIKRDEIKQGKKETKPKEKQAKVQVQKKNKANAVQNVQTRNKNGKESAKSKTVAKKHTKLDKKK